jgi:glutamate mutase epsilon subunit
MDYNPLLPEVKAPVTGRDAERWAYIERLIQKYMAHGEKFRISMQLISQTFGTIPPGIETPADIFETICQMNSLPYTRKPWEFIVGESDAGIALFPAIQ